MPTIGRLRGGAAHRAVEGLAERVDPAVRGRQAIARTGGAGDDGSRLARLTRVGADHQRGLVDRIERARRHLLELVDQGCWPPRIGGSAEVPVGAVVGQDQPVVLHGPQDHLRLGRVARDVVARLQTEPCAHGREVGVARRSGLVTGRPEIRRVRRLGRHPDGVGDRARQHLVVAEQTRQDGQAGGVRRGPSGRTERVRTEVPDGPRARRRSGRAVPARRRARRGCRWTGRPSARGGRRWSPRRPRWAWRR